MRWIYTAVLGFKGELGYTDAIANTQKCLVLKVTLPVRASAKCHKAICIQMQTGMCYII